MCVRACIHGPVYRKSIGIFQRHGCAVILQSCDSLCDCGVIWIRVKRFGPLLANFSPVARWDIHSYKLHMLMVGFTHHLCVCVWREQSRMRKEH